MRSKELLQIRSISEDVYTAAIFSARAPKSAKLSRANDLERLFIRHQPYVKQPSPRTCRVYVPFILSNHATQCSQLPSWRILNTLVSAVLLVFVSRTTARPQNCNGLRTHTSKRTNGHDLAPLFWQSEAPIRRPTLRRQDSHQACHQRHCRLLRQTSPTRLYTILACAPVTEKIRRTNLMLQLIGKSGHCRRRSQQTTCA